jgi:hypothetical protein
MYFKRCMIVDVYVPARFHRAQMIEHVTGALRHWYMLDEEWQRKDDVFHWAEDWSSKALEVILTGANHSGMLILKEPLTLDERLTMGLTAVRP